MRRKGSKSRMITDQLLERLAHDYGRLDLARRDLADGVRFIDERWIAANFTDPSERSPEQRSSLAYSDALLSELQAADILVIGSPIYNFGIPAALKAWIDMVTRAREAFQYGPNGSEGLLTGKKAFLVIVSGGTEAGSSADFATPYLKHALNFIGIDDITLIAADAKHGPEAAIERALSWSSP